MDDVRLNKPLRTFLYSPQAHAAKRVGIETLGDFAHVIEQFGLVDPQTANEVPYFADLDHAPKLRNFGMLSWSTVLAELTTAGFNWRPHLVTPHPGRSISEQNDTALRLTLRRRIDELVELLQEYQRRNPELGEPPNT